VPAEHGFRPHQEDGALPVTKQARDDDEQTALERREGGPRAGAGGDDELLAQECVLGNELLARAERIRGEPGQDRRRTRRGASACVRAVQRRGQQLSDAWDQPGRHAADLCDRAVTFKARSERASVRSWGGSTK